MTQSISNDQNNDGSLILDDFKLIALIAAGAFGLWQYVNTARRQFEAPLWEKQIQLYFSSSETAAQLVFRPVIVYYFWTRPNG